MSGNPTLEQTFTVPVSNTDFAAAAASLDAQVNAFFATTPPPGCCVMVVSAVEHSANDYALFATVRYTWQ